MSSIDRIALITGANKGIGLETAKQLGREGITVLIGARDPAKAKAAADALAKERIDARPITIDVDSQPSIDGAAAQIKRDFGRLDILVNNAGIMVYATDGTGDGPAASIPGQALRKTFDTNFFGMVAVTQAMLPLLKAGGAGRIVNLTSILGSLAEHSDPNSPIYSMKLLGYNASKAAVNMFTNHLAYELRETKIKVNAAHPGWVKTDMGGPGAPLELADGAKTSVWLATLPAEGPTGGYYHMQTHLRW